MPGYRPLSDGPGVGSLDADEERPLRSLLPSDAEDRPEVGADRALLREHVEAALGALPERERFVVGARWGLSGHDGRAHTLDEIAPMLGVSRARVGQIEKRALERLRFRLQGLLQPASLRSVWSPSTACAGQPLPGGLFPPGEQVKEGVQTAQARTVDQLGQTVWVEAGTP